MKHKGAVLKGKLLRVGKQPCYLLSRSRRCVLDFKGRRCVLVAYCDCVRAPEALAVREQESLTELGFVLPGHDSAQTGEVPSAKPKARAAPLRRDPCKEPTVFSTEISGTAGLAAQLRLLGMVHTFGADHIIKAGAKATIVKVDVMKPENHTMVRAWLHSPQCRLLHCEVPRGAVSRAREIKNGGTDPLRSDTHSEGLTWLEGLDKCKVTQAANNILCHELGVEWSVEQPRRSLFWSTTYWRSVAAPDPICAIFDACIHGGSRAKSTKIATSIPDEPLEPRMGEMPVRICHGYPRQLCQTCAKCVANALRCQRRLPPVEEALQSPDRAPSFAPELGSFLTFRVRCLPLKLPHV